MNTKNCCVDSCTSSSIREQDKGVTFHRLPKNPALKSKWIRQARVNLEDNKNKWNYICSRHFRKIDFEAYKASKFSLKIDAIPTIFPWGITPLEDLIKIFPADDSCNLPPIHHSSDTEIKSDGETKSCSSKDSEEDNKSESEIPIGSLMEKGEDIGDSADIEYEVEDDKQDESVVSPDKEEGPEIIDYIETSTIEDQSACSMSTESTSEVVEEEIVPVIVLKKKRGRRSNQEILLAKLAADQERALLDKERGVEEVSEVPVLPEKRIKFPGRKSLFDLEPEPRVTTGAKRGPKPKGRRTLTPKSSKKQTNALKQETFEAANDSGLFPDLLIDEVIALGHLKFKDKQLAASNSFIKEETLGEYEPATGGLFLDATRELVPLKSEKFNSSPMLKALIEKKTPMPKSKPNLANFLPFSGSDGESKPFDNPKYSMSEKGASGGAEKGVMVPGARVEAKDFSEQWYAARIMEVDHEELEVLIHYDNWSQRYDEWISMSSPRLRVLDPPCGGPPAVPSYGEGERCLARWSDNRRFAATVQKVLPDGKYQVKFDDGFIRTLKWANLAKADTISPLSTASVTTISSSSQIIPLTPLTPIPYRAKMPAPTLPAAPTSLPPPIHNHLFDPSRDHLGSKEERRDMKRKLVVKDLFQKDHRHAGRIKVHIDKRLKKFRRRAPAKSKPEQVQNSDVASVNLALTAPPDNLESYPTDLSQLMADEWSCHWLDGRPIGKTAPLPAERGDRGGRPAHAAGHEESKGPRLERMSVQVQDHRLPEGWNKYLTRRCVGNSRGKWDVVLVCPTGRRYRSRIEVRAYLSEPEGAHLEAYAHCLQDFSVHRKLARRLGWDHTSSTKLDTPSGSNPAIASMNTNSPKRTNSPANRIRKRISSPALKSKRDAGSPALKIKIKKEVDSPLGSPKHKAELVGSPVLKIQKEEERVSSPVMKIGRVASPALKMNEQVRVGSPAFKVKTEGDQVESPQHKEEVTIPAVIPPAVPEVPPSPIQPPLEDGFIYVGSLKVQVIDNLLRCPKEGCFKNFRKDNFLQMHIKHYHTDLLSFLGETLNVADLAYARTIAEDVSPVKPALDKPHKPKERKSLPVANATSKPESMIVVKEEIVNVPECRSPEPLTTLKPCTSLEVLDKSPKLRTLLESKPEIKVEAGLSKSKQDNQDAEDYMTTHKIKNDPPAIAPDVITPRPVKTEVPKRSLKRPPEKEISKSRVKSIISKIAAEEGKRSRSQSPKIAANSSPHVEFKTEYSEPIVPTLETDIFPTPHKSKKKSKKRHSESADFRHIKKKKPTQNMDIWTAFTDEMDETRSSFGSPDMIAAQTTVATPVPAAVDSSLCDPNAEVTEEINTNTFVTDTGEKIKIVHMKREEIINCHCGFGEEDGLMIQCELCLCWQHALCHNIERESDVPDKYVCRICLHPPRGRRSQRHLNNQDWLYEGRLARCGLPVLDAAADQRRAAALRRSHQLAGNLLHAASLLNSLRCKIQVSQKKDHPKLYLWSKPWDVDSPIDEFIPKPEENGKDLIVKHENHYQGDSSVDYPTNDLYTDITIDQVKLEEVGETLEVSEVNDIEDMDDGVPKCDNEVELCTSEPQGSGAHDNRGVHLLSSMLSSPGGTPLHLPITKSDLDNMTKAVQVSAPQPEAAIDPGECRMRLLQHVERTQALLDARLDSIEAQIAELESQDPSLADDESPEHFPRTKQTIQMLLRDLNTMEELGMISN